MPQRRLRPTGAPRWWFEVCLAVLFYLLYARVRDAQGRATGAHATEVAFRHGRDVGHAESLLGIRIEVPVQQVFLHVPWLLRVLGGFYGSAHFAVTAGVLGWLLWRHPQHYRRWRTQLAVITLVAVVLFALYPTAPPRLIPGTGVQDTLSTVGGLWSYNNGVLEHITDPYAAMPSLHLSWSCWCSAALAGTVGRTWSRWRRLLFGLYPALVTLTVLVTGTHWLLDTIAGMVLALVVIVSFGRILNADNVHYVGSKVNIPAPPSRGCPTNSRRPPARTGGLPQC